MKADALALTTKPHHTTFRSETIFTLVRSWIMALTITTVSEQTQHDTSEHPLLKKIRESTPTAHGRYVLGFIYDYDRYAPASRARFCPGEDRDDVNVGIRAMRRFIADLVEQSSISIRLAESRVTYPSGKRKFQLILNIAEARGPRRRIPDVEKIEKLMEMLDQEPPKWYKAT